MTKEGHSCPECDEKKSFISEEDKSKQDGSSKKKEISNT
jgi:hypothetical protein|tara:strand:+ start:722 stop:838 length:117 start_codon:yes stop_codon:yes gene_type:complete